MSSTLVRHPELPLYIRTLNSDFDPSREFTPMLEEHLATLDAQTKPVYLLNDLRLFRPGFDELLGMIGSGRKYTSLTNHAMLIESLYIVPDRFIELAIKGMTTVTFGNLRVRPFGTLEEAVAYVRASLGENAREGKQAQSAG